MRGSKLPLQGADCGCCFMGGNENHRRYFQVLGGRRDLSGRASLKPIRNLWTKKNPSPGVILFANVLANPHICRSDCQSRVCDTRPGLCQIKRYQKQQFWGREMFRQDIPMIWSPDRFFYLALRICTISPHSQYWVRSWIPWIDSSLLGMPS